MKWPEKKCESKRGRETAYEEGWNDAIEDFRVVMEDACGREALAQTIHMHLYGEKLSEKNPTRNLLIYALADAIRQHLGLKDK